MQAKPFRENYHLPAAGWSDWKRVMVPNRPEDDPENLQARNGSGSRCRNIGVAFPRDAERCGIYELQARREVHHTGWFMLDARAAIRTKKEHCEPGFSPAYCSNGSHKRDLINDALDKGYELWVRVKSTGNTTRIAESRENELLDRYNYAWNERKNGVRHILP